MQFHMAQTFPPGNDNFGSAETITSLPFTATVDATDATNEVDEPQYCTSMPATIWYSFTAPETTKLQLDTQGSVVSGNVNVYHVTGAGFPGLQFILCSAFTNRAAFIAEAGETYYFQVGGFGQAGTVQFNLSEAHTISGHLTNALTGAPLPGNTPPFGTAHLYRICGDGCLEFVNSQNTDGEGRFIFDSYYYGDPLPAGSYQITATASLYQTGQFGPFEFSGANLDVGNLPLTPPSLIRGRVVDARTGNPLIGAFITLRRCDSGGCFEFVGSQTSDGDGQFQFNSFYFGDPLTAGTYELEISATLYVTQHVPVTLSEGEDHNLGNVLIEPVPLIGSISGRLIDAVSGKPISQTFSPELGLYYCNENGCFLVKSMAPDAEGRFRFEMDAAGNRLIAGSYQVSASADQYEYAQTDVFEVGENMDGSAGDIRLKSFPVRFSDVQPCAEIPATGGNCVFTVKISNGTGKSQAGKTWSMANSALPGSLIGYTNFQIKDPQDLALGVGKSKVFRFQFSVPANTGPYGTDICTRIFVGEGGQAFLNTIGVRDLFCVLRNANGFTITASQAVSSASQVNPTPAATGTEVEPNDSCQTAQDIGAISGTFVMDGNLDSSAAPDVDFFRFSGTPNAPVIVDHEGQATGKGTLGDPYLGFFDSNCNLIAVSDDYNTLNSHLEINVPADGVYILAATSYPDFAFTGGGFGSYQLTVAPVEFISSISGVITDALNGKTLPGDVAPFTYARLLRCEGPFGCFDVNSQNTASDGSFHFTGDFNGGLLRTGNYMIIAAADQYQATETEVFSVGNGEDYAAGQIALNSYPIRFSDTQVCAVPSQGGLCDFKVIVTNGLATKFSGRAWSIIEGYNIGSFANFTIFQADAPADITLASGKSTVLRFRFLVRGSVANGAEICATVFAGPNPSPFFNVVGQRFLFCFTKGPNGFTLLSEKEMQSRLQHMPLQEIAPKNKPSPKK